MLGDGPIDRFSRCGADGAAFMVKADLAHTLDAERSECAEADMEGDASIFYSFGGELCKKILREVQARSGGRDGTALAGKDGLIAVAVGAGVVTTDVGRQRHVSDRVEDREEVANRREFEQAFTEWAALKDFGFERRFS